MEFVNPGALVDADRLEQRLGDPAVAPVDGTYFLPNQDRDAAERVESPEGVGNPERRACGDLQEHRRLHGVRRGRADEYDRDIDASHEDPRLNA